MPNSKQIVYLSQAQYQELITNQSITVDGVTVTYDENDIYVTPQAEPVTDVRINGTSITNGGIANIPRAGSSLGTVAINQAYGIGILDNGTIGIVTPSASNIKSGLSNNLAITPGRQHYSAFYGLAKAAGHDEASSTEPVGTYTPEAKGAIQQMLGVSDLIAPAENNLVASKAYAIGDIFTANGKLYKATSAIAADAAIIPEVEGEEITGANCVETNLVSEEIKDVQVNGTSIVNNGVANVPLMTNTTPGVIGINSGTNGLLLISNGTKLAVQGATTTEVKAGTNGYKPIMPSTQHRAAFYGLASAAGDTTQSASSNAVGTYTDEAKTAIRSMLGAASSNVIAVQDTQPTDTDTKIWLPETAETPVQVPTVSEMEQAIEDASIDVQIDGTSIVSNGVANIPIATTSPGVVGVNPNFGIGIINNQLMLNNANSENIKAGNNSTKAISTYRQHESVFYGLAKIAGFDEKNSTLSVGTYTDEAKAAIQHMLGTDTNLAPYEADVSADAAYAIGEMFMLNGKLHQATAAIAIGDTFTVGTNCEVVYASNVFPHDVQIDGTSIVNNGVANVPPVSGTIPGVIKIGITNGFYGIKTLNTEGVIAIQTAQNIDIKNGANDYKPITPLNQHAATFYGLAKAAGDTTQSASSNAVGTYTDNAKASIKSMLGIVDGSTGTVDVSGTTPTITAVENTRYVCGEVTSLDFTPAASGICIVRFTSGSTVTVLTLPSTVKFPEWFDPTSLETNTIYEICVTDGVYGAVMSWAQ